MRAELLRIKVKKTVNTDDFQPWVTRDFAEFLCEPLTDIINTMFSQYKTLLCGKWQKLSPYPK